MLRCILTLIAITLCCHASAQPYIDNVPKAFGAIQQQPQLYTYASNAAGSAGGHLQGVQLIGSQQAALGSPIIITASGAQTSYLVSADISDLSVSIKEIKKSHISTSALPSPCNVRVIEGMPYRHAGGCQAAGNVFAVGIEDNIAKDKAKVLLLSTDTNAKPITIAERRGTYERSTAGATGLVRLKDGSYLVAVGDWDTKNIDFYQSKPSNVAAFDSIATYKADTISTWGSYQSINLIQQADGKLYLIGFCLDAKGSRADLFSLTLEGGAKVQAVASRHFKTTKGVSFRYGAGLHVTAEKNLHIIACTRTLKKGRNYLNVWK